MRSLSTQDQEADREGNIGKADYLEWKKMWFPACFVFAGKAEWRTRSQLCLPTWVPHLSAKELSDG